MLGATVAKTKQKSTTTTQNIETSRRSEPGRVRGQDEIGGAESGNLEALPLPH
jgi:hypothetical protein